MFLTQTLIVLALLSLAGAGVCAAISTRATFFSRGDAGYQKAYRWAGHAASFLLSALIWMVLSFIPLVLGIC